MSSDQNSKESLAESSVLERELQQVRDALRGLRFGSVNIIVQDGLVIQIDRTEKRRLRNAGSQARSQ